MKKTNELAIPWTGFVQVAYDPETLLWTGPAYVTEDYPRTATWTVSGYRDDETGSLVGELTIMGKCAHDVSLFETCAECERNVKEAI